MKQPLILFSGLFAVGIFCQEKGWLPQWTWIILGIGLVVFVIWDKLRPAKLTRPFALLTAGLLCGSLFFTGYTGLLVEPIRQLDRQILWIRGQVRDYPEIYEDSIRAEISVDACTIPTVRWDFKTKVYLPIEYQNLKPGDEVSFLAQFYQATVYDGFDKESYLESKGFYVLVACKDSTGISTISADHLPFWAYPKAVAHKIRETVQNLYPQREAGFLVSMLLGDKSGIQTEDYIALKKAGIVHVTAVSGMHVGFLVAFLLLLFGRRRGSLIAVLFVIFFVFVAGASPSVVRAAIMYTVMAAAYWLDREASGLNSMFFALLVILLFNPYALFGLSLQLSFGATAGILLFSSKISRLIPGKSRHRLVQKILIYGKQTLACTAGSMVFTTPILMISFDYLSVVSVLTNFLVLPIVSLAFILGYLSCLGGLAVPVLGKGLALVVRPLLAYILTVSGGISRFSYAVVFADGSICYIIMGMMYGLLALGYGLRRKIPPRFVVVGLVVLWFSAGICGGLRSGREQSVTVLPAGYGQTILVSGEKEGLILVDCSGSGYRDSVESVREWMLLRNYDRLDALVLTAVDQSHARSAPALLSKVSVDRVILPAVAKNKELEAEILSAAEKSGTAIIRCGEEAQREIYYPAFGMKIYGDIAGKTVVETPQLLVTQSLTQNMLAEFLAKRPLQARLVAFAAGNLTDYEKLKAALDILQPQGILLESGYPFSEKIEEIPVYNTFTDGEISIQD